MDEEGRKVRTGWRRLSDLSVAQVMGILIIALVIAVVVFVILVISGLAMLT